MLKMGTKSFIIILILFTFFTCIDPYSPKLTGYETLLVVDGLITDENASYTVRLTGTIQEQNAMPFLVSDAKVFITDDIGGNISLVNRGKGIYKTDSVEFKGVIGRTYVLHIITHNGDEYESEACLMQSVPEIDSIYYVREQELVSNGTKSNDGIRIYLNSKPGGNNQYYRWDFEETWKFKVPTPKKFDYVNDTVINPVSLVREYCWKSRKSDEILIHSIYSGQSDRIENEPVLFIASENSDRLLIQYSILVRQYSVSKKEYEFWNNMNVVNESGGDIFARQPFSVKSNIHNINHPGEQVLGYFQVSAMKQKRKDIAFKDLAGTNLPYYHNPCERIEMALKDYPWPPLATPLTWDGLYEMYATSGYYFVEPKYSSGISKLEKLVFALPECANCELTGTMTKPDFWVDLN
jgi:hypothetical protein